MDRERERLFEEHRGYARALALDLVGHLTRSVSFDDIHQAALLGLWEAVTRFDPERGVAFGSFAYLRIRGAVVDELRRACGRPRDVARAAAQIDHVDDAVAELARRAAAASSDEDLAGAFAEAARVLRVIPIVSRIGGGDDAPLDGVDNVSAAMRAEEDELLRRLVEERRCLPARQATVIELLYERGLTTKEAGRLLGVDKSQISRDHGKALDQLRASLERDRLRERDGESEAAA